MSVAPLRSSAGQAVDRILVVDDDPTMHTACRRVLEAKGYELVSALTGLECLTHLASHVLDLVLLDYKMPDLDGIEVLRRIRQGDDPDLGVVIITGKGDMQSAIEALRLGALDYVTKPMGADDLTAVVERSLEVTRIKRHLRRFAREGRQGFRLRSLIGESRQMQQVCDTLVRVATSPLASILIRGETGTGKSLVARALHDNSPRAHAPFVQINCTAIPADLAEVELFGHEKGAFTDAHGPKKGYVEQADGGTLFLDEIGYMPLGLQPKFLNVLEEKRFRRVGGFTDVTVDVRVVAATNRNLEEAIARGEFREDLFYRLNVITLDLPSLRERKEDIPLLARHFLSRFSQEGHRDVVGLSPEAETLLLDHPWPGNVRELRNVMERAVLLGAEETITSRDLSLSLSPALSLSGMEEASIEDLEKTHVLRVLQRAGGNRAHAARILGVSVDTLRRRLKVWGEEQR